MKKGKEPLGAIPTPRSIVTLMVTIAFDYVPRSMNQTRKSESVMVLDNSVGDGRFLFTIMEHWKKHKKKRKIALNLTLHGVDINNSSIKICESNKKEFQPDPDIDISFKTGNALIGYVKPPMNLKKGFNQKKLSVSFFNNLNIDQPSARLKDTVFHWFYEWPFPNSDDGYDLCIGNPPFGISFSIEEKNFYKRTYKSIDPEVESYLLFVERSIHLLRDGGFLVFLIPNNFTTNYRYQVFREFLLESLVLKKIIMLDNNIFPQVSVETCIIVGYKKTKDEVHLANQVEFSKYSIKDGFSQIKKNEQLLIMNQMFKYIVPDMKTETTQILIKMEESAFLLEDIAYISRGIEFGFNSPHTSNQRTKHSVPLIAGRNIQKYTIKGEKRFVEFDSTRKSIFKDKSMYTTPKILLRRIGHELIAVYDPNNIFCVCDVYLIRFKKKWVHIPLNHLEIILNSSLLTFYLNHKFQTIKKVFPKIPIGYLKQLPIKLPFSSEEVELIEKLGFMKRKITPSGMNDMEKMILNHYKLSQSQKQVVKSFKPFI
ncbi:MAG: TaqI-like C-terminal specificity domain-containing protein [Candidatus Hodarchaeales archaeon]